MSKIPILPSCLGLLAISPFWAHPTCFAEPPTATAETTADWTVAFSNRQHIEALILRLRSPNRDPNPKWESGPVSYPDDYDLQAQRSVEDARRKLISLGKDAFPFLIEHINDKEYSLSFSTSILRGFSVGEVCFMIIERQVDLAGVAYKGRDGSDGKSHVHRRYFSQYCAGRWFTQAGIQKWWETHQQLSLREMQIEALRWAIQREQNIGFSGENDRKHYLGPLQERLRKLEAA